MEIKQCEKGHFYKATLDRCPVCEKKSQDKNNFRMKMKSDMFYSDSISREKMNPSNETLAAKDYYETSRVQNYKLPKPIINKEESEKASIKENILPVVGWLVCIKGTEKGKDYRIHAGYNYIGRAATMDIVLSDDRVSGEKDCFIGYDSVEKKYFLGYVNGTNMILVNGRQINGFAEIKSGDYIVIGSCEYRFHAFCGKDFDWN